MKKIVLTYLAMMIAVAIAGEMKFYPIENNLRVSLGTPVFFFFLLWSQKIRPILAGFLVGLAVVAFRLILGNITGDMGFEEMIIHYFPVFFYYISFSALFQFINVKRFYYQPLYMGIAGIVLEIIASMSEITVRSFFYRAPLTWDDLLVIAGIAVVRSFIVLGFFNIMLVREIRQSEKAQRQRTEEMIMLISNLHVETIQMKKTMKNAEQLTNDCYELYRCLKEKGDEKFAKSALKIAGEMHETKKDSQRIYAGLSKLMDKENLSDFLPINEIIDLVVTANQHYAHLLEKQILIKSKVDGIHPTYHTFMLLSIINNLVANAVEAIHKEGEIELDVTLKGNVMNIYVKDSGTGISIRNEQLIFTPGFTTKFDDSGMASSGIGLTYVKDMINCLNGEIGLKEANEPYNTVFKLSLPLESLTEKG